MSDQTVVTHIVRETQDSVIVSLTVPTNKQEEYRYKQGQNLTLIRDFNGEEVRRSYSICASVRDNELRVAIKQVEGGKFSTWANHELRVGETLGLLPPSGHFYVELNPLNKNHYVGIAAGSGITPILSILKTTLETEPNSSFTLLYGNKSTDSIMFLEEIEDLKNKFHQRFVVFNILSQEMQSSDLLSGRITAEKISVFLQSLIDVNNINEVFLCGPYQMITSAQESFIAAGLDNKHIHTELFGTPAQTSTTHKANPALLSTDEQGGQLSSIVVIIDGKSTKFKLARASEAVLDAALKIRKDLPYACKGGVCATCKAKVIEGEVAMDLNYSLSDDELKQGFVLSCQAHPVSDNVIISFDEK